MTDGAKDIPRTSDEIAKIADAEEKAGTVDQQSAAEDKPKTK